MGAHPWVGKIPWRRAWQPTPVFQPGEPHGQRSLVGYSPQCRKESDTTSNLAYTHANTVATISAKELNSVCLIQNSGNYIQRTLHGELFYRSKAVSVLTLHIPDNLNECIKAWRQVNKNSFTYQLNSIQQQQMFSYLYSSFLMVLL